MATLERTFRVFVSSTFNDLKAERDVLQETAFRNLRAYCASRGARFQAIDLRWGISEEASRAQQTMDLCEGELRRCQHLSPRPNFIVLLGNRYGWQPLPSRIPVEEFDQVLSHVSPDEREL